MRRGKCKAPRQIHKFKLWRNSLKVLRREKAEKMIAHLSSMDGGQWLILVRKEQSVELMSVAHLDPDQGALCQNEDFEHCRK
jgi:hypothetical protein